jgi:hypothetical protein
MDMAIKHWYIQLDKKYLEDSRFNQLEEKIRYYYFAFYLLACRAGGDGTIQFDDGENMTINDLAYYFHTNKETIKNVTDNLIKIHYLSFENGGFIILRYVEEQAKVEKTREDNNSRQQRLREKERKEKEIREEEIKEEEIREKNKRGEDMRGEERNLLHTRDIRVTENQFRSTSSLGTDLNIQELQEEDNEVPF